MSTLTLAEQNKELCLRFFDEALNKFNKSILDEVLSPYYKRYDPAMPNGVGTIEDLRNFIGAICMGLPDVNHVPVEVIATDEKVVTRFEASARHTGELMGIPPTGRDVKVRGISIDTVQDGKITETNVMWDLQGLLQQIGAG